MHSDTYRRLHKQNSNFLPIISQFRFYWIKIIKGKKLDIFGNIKS